MRDLSPLARSQTEIDPEEFGQRVAHLFNRLVFDERGLMSDSIAYELIQIIGGMNERIHALEQDERGMQ